jgi:hypothetical protein
MELRFSKSNNIRTSYSSSSTQDKQYYVDLGTILYNDTFLDLNSLVIPFKDQKFFTLPQDKNKYAVVNIYYDAEHGHFIFDKLGIFDKYVDKLTATAIFNALPVAQFILHENQGGFEVVSYNEYSQMSTFTITDTFTQGETGLKADSGETGSLGVTGQQGDWGWTGPVGDTGCPGVTGMSYPGITGPMGETGVYIDEDLLLYLKFKTSDNRQTDFSPYERDVSFYYTGIYDSDGIPLSYFIKEPGVVDSCHNVIYGGGISDYRRGEFFEFGRETGTLSAWVKLMEKPLADFSYRIDDDDNYLVTGPYGDWGFTGPVTVHFTDTSRKHPTAWKWWMDYDISYQGVEFGTTFTIKNVIYTFPFDGKHIVKLRAINSNGYNEVIKFVNLSAPISNFSYEQLL